MLTRLQAIGFVVQMRRLPEPVTASSATMMWVSSAQKP
jgi:hypothetical protein